MLPGTWERCISNSSDTNWALLATKVILKLSSCFADSIIMVIIIIIIYLFGIATLP